jgi:hypothetical protein
MKNEDVKIGDKVVPFQKTGYFDKYIKNTFKNYLTIRASCRAVRSYEENGYCIVSRFDKGQNAFVLSDCIDGEGDYFNAADFTPYIETDNPLIGLLLAYCRATDTDTGFIDLLFKKPIEPVIPPRKSRFKTGDIVAVCDGSYSLISRHGKMERSFGSDLGRMNLAVVSTNQLLPANDENYKLFERDKKFNDIILKDVDTGDIVYIQERFLNLVKSAEVKEDKPVFEVGEWVRVREDLVEDKCNKDTNSVVHAMLQYSGKKTKVKKQIGKSFFLEIDGGYWYWSVDMLEKIPQPPKEKIIDGVKYIRSEE